jgi:ABC-type transporter Mla subunit MlaD
MRSAPRRDLVTSLRAHQGAVGALVVLAAALVTVLAMKSTNGIPLLPKYELQATLPKGAPNVRVGGEVRIAGQNAGVLTRVGRAPNGAQHVRLTLRQHPVGRDARLTLRLRAPVGQHYLALDRGNFTGDPAPSGATIAPGNVRFTDDLPTVVEDFSVRALGQAKRSIQLGGSGVLGRGAELNRSLDGLDQTVADTTSLLRAAAPGHELPDLVRGAATTATALQGRAPDDLGRLVTASGRLLATLGDPRVRLGATLDQLPRFEQRVAGVLPQVDPLLEQTTVLARRLRPGVAALHEALPAVNRLLTSAPTFRRSVPPLAAAARPALQALTPVLRRVGASAVLLGRALPPLQGFAAYLARFPREIESGLTSYYVPYLYRPDVGRARGYTAAPAMLVLTCAPGHDDDRQPGSVFTDRLQKPCR